MMQHVRWLGIFVALAIMIADLSSKDALVSFLTGSGDRVELLPFLDLRLGYNRGISFGLLGSYGDWMPWVLALVAFLVSAYLATLLRRATNKRDAIWIGLIIGGALGNAIDRLMDGVVTDFLDVHVFGIHWPTFNGADMAIILGVAILLLRSIRPSEK